MSTFQLIHRPGEMILLLFHHVIIDERWNDRYSDDVFISVRNDRSNLFVLHADHILSIDFQQLIFDQQAISGCRRVLDDGRDFPIAELETNVSV